MHTIRSDLNSDTAAIGTLLGGRYRLERKLAEGGMGSVFLATQVQLEREVAIKMIRPEVLEGRPDLATRFMMEAGALSKLVHTNIVTVYDYGESVDGQLYIAMERLHGTPLSDAVRHEGPLSFLRVVRVGVQIARALRHAHSVGIIHRDLRPANVMLVRGADDEDRDHAKVLDFGLAKLVQPGAHAELEAAGIQVGAPSYMSPEQASGRPDIDERSDIYSLGCVLFYMVTGIPPFVGESSEQITRQHLEGAVPELCEVGYQRDCPPALERVINRCLEKRPEDRYASMSELVQELKAAYVSIPRLAARSTSRSGISDTSSVDSFSPIPPSPDGRTDTEMAAVPRALPAAAFVDPSVEPATREMSGVLERPQERSKTPLVLGLGLLLLGILAASFALVGGNTDPDRPLVEHAAPTPAAAPIPEPSQAAQELVQPEAPSEVEEAARDDVEPVEEAAKPAPAPVKAVAKPKKARSTKKKHYTPKKVVERAPAPKPEPKAARTVEPKPVESKSDESVPLVDTEKVEVPLLMDDEERVQLLDD